MKKHYLFLVSLLISTLSFGQETVSIPDTNFEQALIDLVIDSDGLVNGQILRSDAEAVGSLIVVGKAIDDLTGIEAFVNMTSLNCANNNLIALDVTSNINLNSILCFNNKIETLNTSNLLSLNTIICFGNVLEDIDVSTNLGLTELGCSSNKLSSIDVSNNLNLLDLTITSNLFTNIDISKNLSLQDLNVGSNQLTNIDISENSNLRNFSCNDNQFTSIDVSKNLLLEVFGCVRNQVNNIDVSNNLQLTQLLCADNLLTILSLSKNTKLIRLIAQNNQLERLDIRNGNNANVVRFHPSVSVFDITGNNLTCIKADDVISQEMIDSGGNFSNDCGDFWTIYTADTNVDSALASYGNAIDVSGDGKITLNEAAAFTGVLDLRNQGIIDIQGLQAFTSVSEIDLSGNDISDLSVLFGSAPVILTAKRAQFKTVASSNFTSLSVLNISNNGITSLDLSNITTLTSLDCSNNQLESLNLQSGNNYILTSFNATNNSSLTCAQVDDVAWSNSNWTNKDTQTSFSTNCSAGLDIEDAIVNKNITFYPNPVKHSINLKSDQIIKSAVLYSLHGQELRVFNKESISNNSIDVSNYLNGIYFLKLEINSKVQVLKFVKQ